MFGQQVAPKWRLRLPGQGALDCVRGSVDRMAFVCRELENSVGALGPVQDSCLNIAGPG